MGHPADAPPLLGAEPPSPGKPTLDPQLAVSSAA